MVLQKDHWMLVQESFDTMYVFENLYIFVYGMTQWNGKITMNGKNEANKNGRYNYGYNWNTGIQIKSLELKLRSLALSSTYSPIPSAFFRKCEIMRGKKPIFGWIISFFFFLDNSHRKFVKCLLLQNFDISLCTHSISQMWIMAWSGFGKASCVVGVNKNRQTAKSNWNRNWFGSTWTHQHFDFKPVGNDLFKFSIIKYGLKLNQNFHTILFFQKIPCFSQNSLLISSIYTSKNIFTTKLLFLLGK